MSDVADEELLNDEEFDYESYDLGCEEEDALLEEDKDYESSPEDFKRKGMHSEKKEPASDEEEDVLHLDIEEDFQVEDKDELIENKMEGEMNERSQSSNVSTTQVLPKPQIVKRPSIKATTTDEGIKTTEQSVKKILPNFDNKRKRGMGRGNFQTRPNFIRNNSNNMQRDRRPGRRNGTVFINPKYEGYVQVNENNARLAWDNNSNYSQNNTSFIQPWAPGNEMPSHDPGTLFKNLVGLAATFSGSSNLLQMTPPSQPPVLNFEPPPNVYENQVPFQPAPAIQNVPPPYHNQNQVPAPQTSFQPYHSTGPQQFNNQPPSNNYGYYNNNAVNSQQNYGPDNRRGFTQNFDNRNVNYKVTNNQMKPGIQNNYENRNKNTFRHDFSKQEIYQGGNFDYNVQNTYQNKNSYSPNSKINQNPNYNYGFENRNVNNRPENYNRNAVFNNYQQRNLNHRENFNDENPQNTFNNNYNRNMKINYNKNAENRPFRQICTINEHAGQNSGHFQQDGGKSITNRNFTVPRIRRPISSNESKTELPEKKSKIEEKPINDGCNRPSTSGNSLINDEEEDEEMRLYRLKIEEQKRQREKVLKMKEERRRLMLQQQKTEEESTSASENSSLRQQTTSTTIIYHQNANYQQQQRPVNQIPVLTTQNTPHNNFNNNSKSSAEEDVPNLVFKISNNPQRKIPTVEKGLLKNDSSSGNFLSNRAVPAAENTHPKKELLASNFMSDRVVVVKSNSNGKSLIQNSNSNVVKTINDNSECPGVGQGFSSFFNNRKVLKKDNTLINTRLVVVNNLSASTTQNKLETMTRGIGEIQKLRMDKQERQATILFKSVASAHAFFKKYQRYMLDLSMIQVKLEPMV